MYGIIVGSICLLITRCHSNDYVNQLQFQTDHDGYNNQFRTVPNSYNGRLRTYPNDFTSMQRTISNGYNRRQETAIPNNNVWSGMDYYVSNRLPLPNRNYYNRLPIRPETIPSAKRSESGYTNNIRSLTNYNNPRIHAPDHNGYGNQLTLDYDRFNRESGLNAFSEEPHNIRSNFNNQADNPPNTFNRHFNNIPNNFQNGPNEFNRHIDNNRFNRHFGSLGDGFSTHPGLNQNVVNRASSNNRNLFRDRVIDANVANRRPGLSARKRVNQNVHRRRVGTTFNDNVYRTYRPIESSTRIKPYSFKYVAELPDGMSAREESNTAKGAVVGYYTLKHADGRERTVEYVADANGFRAKVITNEPGTANYNSANVMVQSSAPNPGRNVVPEGDASQQVIKKQRNLDRPPWPNRF